MRRHPFQKPELLIPLSNPTVSATTVVDRVDPVAVPRLYRGEWALKTEPRSLFVAAKHRHEHASRFLFLVLGPAARNITSAALHHTVLLKSGC